MGENIRKEMVIVSVSPKITRLISAILLLALLLCGCDFSALTGSTDDGIPSGEEAKRPNTIENFSLKYFLGQEDESAQENLFALYHAAMAFEETCYLPYPMPQERVKALLTLLCYECPELFQLDITRNTTYIGYEGKTDIFSVKLPYCMDKDTYTSLLAQAKQALSQLNTQGMTAAQAEKYLYDTLCSRITYDASSAHCANVYGALVEGRAKCDGISLAMKWAMENAGFVCMCVPGDAVDGGIGHAWNILPIDGKYYHVDVTADVKTETRQTILYPAYNVSLGWLVRYYTIYPFFNLPISDTMDASYHAQKGSFFDYEDNWRSAVKKAFTASYKSGQPFTVQFSTKTAFDACMDELKSLFEAAAKKAGITSWSWSTTYIDNYHLLSVNVKKGK